MKPFKTFIIKGHSFDEQTMIASFSYSFDNETNFTETIDFSCQDFISKYLTRQPANQLILDNHLFHLSIALGISYYKLYPTVSIEIESHAPSSAGGTLNDDQIFFWKQFYINGLGEFFFKNKLKPFSPNFISNVSSSSLRTKCGNQGGLQCSTTGEPLVAEDFNNLEFRIQNGESPKALIPLGGGKDSIVSVELIKKLGIPFNTCTFGKDNPLYEQVNTIIDTPRLFIARKIDPLLFKMNTEGYYNGHVPISGIIAFVLVVAAYLYDYTHIIMSNEKSANEGNTEINGMSINHQRSKSLEFEKAFSHYVEHYMSPNLPTGQGGIKYFSLLRGMYEVKIAQLFAQYPQYFSTFSSCNRNFHILTGGPESTPHITAGTLGPDGPKWCNHCPKCAFVYTILRPRITQEQTMQIFGKELYEDESLIPLFKELLGISGIKPFECVGTNEEMILAMYKAYQKFKIQNLEFRIMSLFESEILPKMSEQDFEKLEERLMKISNEGNIPPEIKKNLCVSP